MDNLNLNFLTTAIIGCSCFVEMVILVFYKRYDFKFDRLKGTGRMADMEITNNYKKFFKLVLVANPILTCLLISNL